MTSMRPIRVTINRPRSARLIRGAARFAWLLVVSGAILAPSALLADTGPGTTGGSSTEPEISLLSRLLTVAVPLAVIAVALGIVIRLAFLGRQPLTRRVSHQSPGRLRYQPVHGW
jgi:hypothetical protein